MNSCPGVNKEGNDSNQGEKKQKKVCLSARVLYRVYHWRGTLVRVSLSTCSLPALVNSKKLTMIVVARYSC